MRQCTNIRAFILFFLSLLLSSCSYKFSSYLGPLNDKMHFNCQFKSGASAIKFDTTELIFQTINIDGEKVYFPIETKDTNQMKSIIGSKHFLQSAMIFRKDSVLLAPCFWRYELAKLTLKDFKFIIPPYVTKKDTVRIIDYGINDDRHIILYGFKKTSLILGEKHLKGCLRINLIEEWPTRNPVLIYKGEIWLHKSYGVVKWIRTTGRIEERKL